MPEPLRRVILIPKPAAPDESYIENAKEVCEAEVAPLAPVTFTVDRKPSTQEVLKVTYFLPGGSTNTQANAIRDELKNNPDIYNSGPFPSKNLEDLETLGADNAPVANNFVSPSGMIFGAFGAGGGGANTYGMQASIDAADGSSKAMKAVGDTSTINNSGSFLLRSRILMNPSLFGVVSTNVFEAEGYYKFDTTEGDAAITGKSVGIDYQLAGGGLNVSATLTSDDGVTYKEVRFSIIDGSGFPPVSYSKIIDVSAQAVPVTAYKKFKFTYNNGIFGAFLDGVDLGLHDSAVWGSDLSGISYNGIRNDVSKTYTTNFVSDTTTLITFKPTWTDQLCLNIKDGII